MTVAELERGGREALVGPVSGTLRVDPVRGGGVEHWYIVVTYRDTFNAHGDVAADTVVRAATTLSSRDATRCAGAVRLTERAGLGAGNNHPASVTTPSDLVTQKAHRLSMLPWECRRA